MLTMSGSSSFTDLRQIYLLGDKLSHRLFSTNVGGLATREALQAGAAAMLGPMISSRVAHRHLAGVWNAFPLPSLLLGADLVILAANARHAEATLMRPEAIIGRELFEVFPDNPAKDGSRTRDRLHASLLRVMARLTPEVLAHVRYDIRDANGQFIERYWTLSNHPVLDMRGRLRFILHTAVDETPLVLAARGGGGPGIEALSDRQAAPAPPDADRLWAAIHHNFSVLTQREKEVLQLAIDGLATKAIAARLSISPRTVEVYRTNILRKTLKENFLELSRAIHRLAASDDLG